MISSEWFYLGVPLRINKQTQFHENNRWFIVSKFPQSDKITKQQNNFFRMILPRYGWRLCPVSAPPLFSSPWTCWDLIFAALASKNTRKIPTLKKKNRFGFVVCRAADRKKNNHNDRAYNASFWFRASTSFFCISVAA